MPTARPKLIVITPVRNEAWVLEAFLKHCSSWADHIIVADQRSTDGSREMAQQFPKVTLIDNPSAQMNQANARQMLFAEADKIDGEKIIFAMDADEFLTDGFQQTESWGKIMSSTPNTVFCFRWHNVIDDMSCKENTDMPCYEWACHFKASERMQDLYTTHECRPVHETRIPCTADAIYLNIEDIQFIHLARLCRTRQRNKTDFYQVSTVTSKHHHTNAISLYRSYHITQCIEQLPTPVRLTTAQGEDITHLVRSADHGQHYVDEMVDIFRREGLKKFRWLCIWDNPDLVAAGIRYRPPLAARLLHRYLRRTQPKAHTPLIRLTDKLLKRILPR